MNLRKCCNQHPAVITVGNMSVVECRKCKAQTHAYHGEKTKGVQGASEAWNRNEVLE